MKRRIVACFMALCMMMSMLPMQIFTVSAAAEDYIATITVVDGYGNKLPGATVTVSRTYTTPGGRLTTRNVAVTAVGDGTYTFSTLATGTTHHYTVNASKSGYPSVSQQVSADSRSIVVMLGEAVVEPEPDLPDEWVTFDMYYIANGKPPAKLAGAGEAINYGPSYNNVPFVSVNVNISALKNKKYADRVAYEENTDGNTYHFIPAGSVEGDEVSDEQRRQLISDFWDCVLECMDTESLNALEATGLKDSFMGYAVKNQGSAYSPDYHCDGILSVKPPVYVVEMHDRGTYFHGFVNDDNTTVFTTVEDVLAAYDTHYGKTVNWQKQADGSYKGYYDEGKHRYHLILSQNNAAQATVNPGGQANTVKYIEQTDIYYLAVFNAVQDGDPEQIVFTVTYKDGVNGTVFADQQSDHGKGTATPSFTGDATRENFNHIGWVLEGGDGEVMSQARILEKYPTVTSNMTFVAAYELKPQTFAGTVEVILNGAYASGVATGERVDIERVKGQALDLYASADGNTFIKLDKTATGVYSARLENGNYHLYYYDGESYVLTGHGQQLDIYNAARTRYLFFNDVIYDLNGGVGGPASLVEYYRTGDKVMTAPAPTKDGYEFLGWLAEDGTLYAAGSLLATEIASPYRLTAQWKKINKASVNVTVIVDGKSADGTVDKDLDREMTIELTYRTLGSAEDYVEVVGKTFTDKDGYYIGETVGNVTTTDYIGLFKDLDIAYEYSANAFMSEYTVTGRAVTSKTDANGDITYHVTIRMQYAPEMRMLEYTVVEKIENDALVPQAVDVKIISFYNPYLYGFDVPNKKAWHPLTQHMNSTHDAFFDTKDANGNWCGHESYLAWTWEDQEQNLSYVYRVSAAGLTLKDGTEIVMVSTDGIEYVSLATADGRYPAGAYKAVVSVTGGKSPDDGVLEGAYFDQNNPDQIGSIVITVTAYPYTVTFDPNGGTLNGTTNNTVLEDQFIAPDVNAYVPTRDDYYVFDRWVLVDENGNPTDETVTAGEALTKDITLVARWKAPKTIEGLVTVGATYMQKNDDGSETLHKIDESERTETAIVLLQHIEPNGYFGTVSSYTVTLDYTNTDYYYLGSRAVGMAYYRFENIPDDGKEYRVQLLLPNYEPMFQNEPESVKYEKQYDTYTEEEYGDYVVLWGTKAPEVGTVNIHNHFHPDTFELEYEVDADAIGEGFRPDSVELLVTSDDKPDHILPQDWTVISQMKFGKELKGDDVALENGLGSGSTPVWISAMDGATYYQYGLRVHTLTFGGEVVPFDGKQPFTVTYEAPTHFHYGAQEDMLKAILTPNVYNVNYVLYGGTMNGDYPTTHTWSYETSLAIEAPTLKGFRFMGWYLDENFTIPAGDKIAASVAADTTLYAKWTQVMDRVDLHVTINHEQANGEGLASNYNKNLVAQLTYDARANEGAANREFAAAEGYTRIYPNGLWHTRGDDVQQDIFQVPSFYANLSAEYDYSAHVTLDGYYVADKKTEKTTQPDGSTLHTVKVVLQYYPDLFDLKFYVRLSDHVKNGEKPISAQVKVTSWADEPSEEIDWQWFHITQHETNSVTVNIDPASGIGYGSYPVWHWYDEAEQIPYYYRLEVVQLNFADGSSVPMNSLVKDAVTFGNGYTATVETEGGEVPNIADANNTTTLEGVYGKKDGDGHAQQGTLGAVIDVNRVVFHANNMRYRQDDEFRTYYYDDMPMVGDRVYKLDENNKVPEFYDIPEFDYRTHNEFIFKGWYMDPVSEDEPFSWNASHSGDVHVYAHWIETGTVEKEEADGKNYTDLYQGYDLVGVQIRDVEDDTVEHYGEAASGLRFVTVLKESVYEEINAIPYNSKGAEYGYVMAKTSTLKAKAGNDDFYTLQYKGANVNGVNTSAEYSYVQNMKCSGVVDHFNGETYRLYTAVITYEGVKGDALQAAYETEFTARSYIRYTDANGLLRTYYNNYTGTDTYHGCSTSFAAVRGMMG